MIACRGIIRHSLSNFKAKWQSGLFLCNGHFHLLRRILLAIQAESAGATGGFIHAGQLFCANGVDVRESLRVDVVCRREFAVCPAVLAPILLIFDFPRDLQIVAQMILSPIQTVVEFEGGDGIALAPLRFCALLHARFAAFSRLGVRMHAGPHRLFLLTDGKIRFEILHRCGEREGGETGEEEDGEDEAGSHGGREETAS